MATEAGDGQAFDSLDQA